MSSKLTLNLGLRYDFDTPRTERYNRMNYFDPMAGRRWLTACRQFPNLTGGLVFAGVDGNSREGSSCPTRTTSDRGSAARTCSTTRPWCAAG